MKNAQEAHEAIRPAGESFRTPDEASRSLSGDEFRLYDMIWKRTVASQMADATGTSAQVRLVGTAADPAGGDGREAEFSASGKVIQFPGFLRAYVEGEDDPDAELADREVHLPPMAEGDPLSVEGLEPGSHATQPPARFTEASLVKAMEELGVGRPSTYASVISTILDRGYVWKKGTALVPSFTAFAVVGLLERYFADLVDYGFTASMEDDLDAIASGDEESLPWLTRFYFGSGDGPRQREPDAVRQWFGGPPARPQTRGEHLSGRDRRPGDQLHPDRDGERRGRDRGPGRALRAVSAARRGPGLDPGGHGPRRADPGRGPRSFWRPRRPTGCSGRIRSRVCRCR